jgi:CheY-like chemotaxis protein
MGGSISIESALEKGSLFRIDLPLNEVKDEDIHLPKELGQGEVVGLAPGQPEYRILIVEDQLENQMLLSQLMKRVGFTVKLADNGEQGVKLFQIWRPHLIWMDRRMPVMDGIEATQIIRTLPGGKEVKIVAVTASAFMEQRTEMLKAGMDDFVRKPYRFNEIYDCLSKQLNVKFIYTDAVIAEDAEPAQLTPQMFTVLPPALCSELADALNSLDSDLINGIILKVAAYDLTLHKTLMHLADRFDYSAIQKALTPN